jgi:hypothetical protein
MMNDETLGGLIAPDAPVAIDDAAPDLAFLKRMFREAASASEESRALANRARDYYDGNQLDAHLLAELARRGQPPTVINLVRRAVDGTLGLLDQSASDPEAIARNDNGDEAATVVTKVLRYLADKTDLEEVKRQISEDNLIPGACAVFVDVDDQNDARATAIPYAEFYYDPYSKNYDFSDARYLIHARWTDLADAKLKFFHRADDIELGGSASIGIDTPSDKPEKLSIWADIARKRVLLVNCYYRDKHTGQWMYAVYCHSTLLEYGVSPFVDDFGRPVCPIIGLSFQISREGHRYGMARDMLPIQNAINGLDSRSLHIAVSAQVQMVDDTALATDAATASEEASKARGVLPRGFQKVPTIDMFQGVVAKLNQYIEMIKSMSPSPSVLGRAEGANQSGRARQIAAAAGYTELARAFARMERMEERIYEQMWFRARQYMSEAKLIRVTNDAGARESLMVNYPVVEPRPVMMPIVGPDGQPVVDPRTGQPAMHPQIGPDGQPAMAPQQVGTHNELATMDVEITITTVRQAVTLRQEAIDSMLEFSAKTGVSVLDPQFEFLVELSSIPDKREILDKMAAIRAKAAQQQQQAQAEQQAMAQQQAELSAQQMQARTAKDAAQAQRDQALASKHAIEAHDQAFDLTVKELALQRAAAHATPAIAQALGQLHGPQA